MLDNCLPENALTDYAAARAMIDETWPADPPSPPPSPSLTGISLMELTGSGKPEDFCKPHFKRFNAGKKPESWKNWK